MLSRIKGKGNKNKKKLEELDPETVDEEDVEDIEEAQQALDDGENFLEDITPGEEEEVAGSKLDEGSQIEARVNAVIKTYCIKVAVAVSAAQGAMAVPGVGTMTAILFSTALSSGLVTRLQKTMISRIANQYGRKLSMKEKRKIFDLVSNGGHQKGKNGGSPSEEMIKKYGAKLAKQEAVALAKVGASIASQSSNSFAKYLPFMGPVGTAGISMTTTFLIGLRAKRYFKLGEDSVKNWTWKDSLDELTASNKENMLVDYMKEALGVTTKLVDDEKDVPEKTQSLIGKRIAEAKDKFAKGRKEMMKFSVKDAGGKVFSKAQETTLNVVFGKPKPKVTKPE